MADPGDDVFRQVPPPGLGGGQAADPQYAPTPTPIPGPRPPAMVAPVTGPPGYQPHYETGYGASYGASYEAGGYRQGPPPVSHPTSPHPTSPHPTSPLPNPYPASGQQTGAFGAVPLQQNPAGPFAPSPVSGPAGPPGIRQASGPVGFGAGPGAPVGPPVHGGLYPSGGAPSRRGRDPLTLILILVLLVVALVQGGVLVHMSGELSDARAAQHKSARLTASQNVDLGNLTKRVQSLEGRTKGLLNTTAVARKALPSVFLVQTAQATGTAFAFGCDASGTSLLTNFHVVQSALAAGAHTATIQRNSESYTVTIDRVDQQRDLAVLHTSERFTPLKPAPKAVEPGDPVIAIGAPLGLADSVTSGIVSAIRAQVQGLNTPVIQFDAPINPGNSGGPVIDADGQVVGIAQAKITSDNADGLGLAIPINEATSSVIRC